MTTEVWQDVKGYEGYYQINSLGNIRSMARLVSTKAGYNKPVNERIIKPRINNKGYLSVCLSKNAVTQTCFVHRLLAEAFISNPDNKPLINHINGNKLDNSLHNLEWVTYSENLTHAYKIGLCAKERVGRKVIDTCTGLVFASIKKAAEYLNINYNTCKDYLHGYCSNPTCLQYAA